MLTLRENDAERYILKTHWSSEWCDAAAAADSIQK